MLDKKEIKAKVDEFLPTDLEKCKEDIVNFIWDYANECWTDGESWGRDHSSD